MLLFIFVYAFDVHTNDFCRHPISQKVPPCLQKKKLGIISLPVWNQLPHNQQRVHKATELNRPKERLILEQSDRAPFDGEDGKKKDGEKKRKDMENLSAL